MQIKEFYRMWRRIPFKKEFPHYNAAQERFGTWNKAIKAAGFKPNPVMFALFPVNRLAEIIKI